jgi:hypothetical protein
MLQSAAIKAWTVGVVALAKDLPTANDDTAMTEVEWRLVSLLKAQGEVGIRTERHFDIGRLVQIGCRKTVRVIWEA